MYFENGLGKKKSPLDFKSLSNVTGGEEECCDHFRKPTRELLE